MCICLCIASPPGTIRNLSSGRSTYIPEVHMHRKMNIHLKLLTGQDHRISLNIANQSLLLVVPEGLGYILQLEIRLHPSFSPVPGWTDRCIPEMSRVGTRNYETWENCEIARMKGRWQKGRRATPTPPLHFHLHSMRGSRIA